MICSLCSVSYFVVILKKAEIQEMVNLHYQRVDIFAFYSLIFFKNGIFLEQLIFTTTKQNI